MFRQLGAPHGVRFAQPLNPSQCGSANTPGPFKTHIRRKGNPCKRKARHQPESPLLEAWLLINRRTAKRETDVCLSISSSGTRC
jgi:hypothetical protein